MCMCKCICMCMGMLPAVREGGGVVRMMMVGHGEYVWGWHGVERTKTQDSRLKTRSSTKVLPSIEYIHPYPR